MDNRCLICGDIIPEGRQVCPVCENGIIQGEIERSGITMDKIDWKRKLTSRKFWVALAGLISGLIAAFGGSEQTAKEVSGLILAAASVVGYLLAEGLTDAAAQNGDVYIAEPEEMKPPETVETGGD